MSYDKDNEKSAHAYTQQRMQQGVRYIKERGGTEGGDVGAVENEESRGSGEEPASPPAARAFVFHSFLLLP
jgi:hypothetical protein